MDNATEIAWQLAIEAAEEWSRHWAEFLREVRTWRGEPATEEQLRRNREAQAWDKPDHICQRTGLPVSTVRLLLDAASPQYRCLRWPDEVQAAQAAHLRSRLAASAAFGAALAKH